MMGRNDGRIEGEIWSEQACCIQKNTPFQRQQTIYLGEAEFNCKKALGVSQVSRNLSEEWPHQGLSNQLEFFRSMIRG